MCSLTIYDFTNFSKITLYKQWVLGYNGKDSVDLVIGRDLMAESKKAVSEFMLCIIIAFAVYIPLCCLGFFIAGRFGLNVLFGALYGSGVMTFHYFLFALATVRAADDEDPENAKKRFTASYHKRKYLLMLLMGAGVYVAVQFSVFHWLPLIAAMLVPRISIAIWQIIQKKKEAQGDGD